MKRKRKERFLEVHEYAREFKSIELANFQFCGNEKHPKKKIP